MFRKLRIPFSFTQFLYILFITDLFKIEANEKCMRFWQEQNDCSPDNKEQLIPEATQKMKSLEVIIILNEFCVVFNWICKDFLLKNKLQIKRAAEEKKYRHCGPRIETSFVFSHPDLSFIYPTLGAKVTCQIRYFTISQNAWNKLKGKKTRWS